MNVRVLSAPAMFSPRLLARTQTARRLRPGKSVRENLPLGFRLSSGLSTSTAAFGADLRDKVSPLPKSSMTALTLVEGHHRHWRGVWYWTCYCSTVTQRW